MRNSEDSTIVENSKNWILIVDDEEQLVRLLKTYIQRFGYNVVTASDGEEGLHLFKQRHFDLVLMDLHMPKLNGDQLLKAVKELNPSTEVIIITGNASVESAIECLGKLGAYDYITKPLYPISMVEPVIRKALERRKLYIENQRLIEELKELNAHLDNKVKEKTSSLEDAYNTLSNSYHELNLYISALIHINQLLLSITWSSDLDYIIENVLHYAVNISDSQNALIIRIDDNNIVKSIAYATGSIEELDLLLDHPPHPLFLDIIEQGKGVSLNDEDDFHTSLHRTKLIKQDQSYIFERFQGVPLKKGDNVIGILAVFNKTESYTKRDLDVLYFLANGATVAIINTELKNELEKIGSYQE